MNKVVNISDNNKKQIKIIKELKAVCDIHNLNFWILGGWGIDALLNKITREHNDIDIIISYSDRKLFQGIVKTFVDGIIEDSEVRLWFYKYNVKCDTRFYKKLENGELILDLDKKDPLVYPTPPDSFPDKLNGKLPGIKVRVVSWSFHYAAKEGYRYYIDVPLRKKDKKDLEVIHKNLSSVYRNELKRYFPGIKRESI